MVGIPLRPVERAVSADLRCRVHLTAPAVGQDVKRQAVLMGQLVEVASMVGQAVPIHLGDE